MNQGYIKLFRKLEDWDWYKNPNVLSLWIHILMKANFQDKKWQGETIKRGSFVTGLKSLSFETGLSIQQIRTSLDKLTSTNNITSKSTNKYRIITVLNYDDYQNDNKQVNSQITNNLTIKQQTNNNNEVIKELKEEKKVIKKQAKKFTRPNIEEVKSYCLEKNYNIDAEYFISFYESNGWKVGKNPMKSWKASLTTWSKRNAKEKTQTINDGRYGEH